MLGGFSIPNVTTPSFANKKLWGKDYYSYGADDKYPQFLWDMYCNCPTHQSIIDGKVNYCLGGGIDFPEGAQLNNEADTIEDIMERVILDFVVYGGFSLQIIYNRAGKISEIYYIDFANIRTNDKYSKFYYIREGEEPIEYEAYNPTARNKTSQIYYVSNRTTRSIYPIPEYTAASNSILTEQEIQNFHLNSIRNGFSVGAIINFNNGQPSDEEKEEIENGLKKKYTGSNNANKFITVYNDSADQAATVTNLNGNDFDCRYNALAKSVQREIFVAHRVTSPTLFGIIPENTGFSKNEYQEAFEIFQLTVVNPMRRFIERAMNRVLPEPMKFKQLYLPTSENTL